MHGWPDGPGTGKTMKTRPYARLPARMALPAVIEVKERLRVNPILKNGVQSAERGRGQSFWQPLSASRRLVVAGVTLATNQILPW
jgi:hypothetical protein